MPNDTSIAHTRQPSTQTMCHSRPRNQLNTFLKHEEKGSHDPPRKSHGYLESRRGMNCLHRFNLLRRPPQILHLATRPIRQAPRPSAMHRRSRRRSTSDTIHGRSPCIKQCSHAATNPMRHQLLSRRRDETYSTSSETVGNESTESAAKHLGHNPRPLTMYKAMLTCGNEPDATSAAFTKTPVFSNLLLKIP